MELSETAAGFRGKEFIPSPLKEVPAMNWSRLLCCLLLISLIVPSALSYSQCSDAGVCIIGKKQHAEGHALGITYLFGYSDKNDDLTFHTLRFEGKYHISDNSSIQISLPYSRQSGPAGSASGIGDLTILWNQTVLHDDATTVQIQGGMKLATGVVNANSLPQAYQSSLGTNDLLFGATYTYREITLAAAYQLTTGRSTNSITRLRRGDDLMLRAGYSKVIDQFTVGGELLAIKRIQESSVLQSTQPETFVSVPNSNQLQLNVVARLTYMLNEQYNLSAEGAFALLKRETNVDGLKRAFTLSLGISYIF